VSFATFEVFALVTSYGTKFYYLERGHMDVNANSSSLAASRSSIWPNGRGRTWSGWTRAPARPHFVIAGWPPSGSIGLVPRCCCRWNYWS